MKLKIKILCTYCGKKLRNLVADTKIFVLKTSNKSVFYFCDNKNHIGNSILNNSWKFSRHDTLDEPFEIYYIKFIDKSPNDWGIFFSAMKYSVRIYKNRKEFIEKEFV